MKEVWTSTQMWSKHKKWKTSIREISKSVEKVARKKIKFEVKKKNAERKQKDGKSFRPKNEGETVCIMLSSDGSLVICGKGC